MSGHGNTTLAVKVSPHLREGESVPLIMWTVVIALAPAGLAGVYAFGWRAALVMIECFAFCIVVQVICLKMRGAKGARPDGSAAVTGLLLAFILPPTVRWYVPLVGAVVAIGLAKEAFGGLGANFFNPALVARAFLQFAFPSQLSLPKWPVLKADILGAGRIISDITGPDAVTRATPLAVLQRNAGAGWAAVAPDYAFGAPLVRHLGLVAGALVFIVLLGLAAAGVWLWARRGKRLFGVLTVGAFLLFGLLPTGPVALGSIPGCIGETSAWALLAGGLALVYWRCIRWQLPVAYILTALLFVLILPVRSGGGELVWTASGGGGAVLAHVFGGGLFLGAFFMITDMVTSPLTVKGQIAFGALAGVLVALIRLYAGYPEGVCYSILLANAARPLIDRYIAPRAFGSTGGWRGTKSV